VQTRTAAVATPADDGTIIVKLTPEQEADAKRWGEEIVRRHPHLTPATAPYARDREQAHIESVRAKVAVGVVLGLAYDGSTRRLERTTGDVARGVHTRYTHYPIVRASLQVRKDDVPDHIYVLVIPGANKTLRIVGYTLGRNAMVEEYWKAEWKYPCWAVPSTRPPLLPAMSLKSELDTLAKALEDGAWRQAHGLDDT
jgi:hypothetical protein